MNKLNIITFENIIFKLQSYWSNQGCIIIQPIDVSVGAGTFHPMTCLRALGPDPIAVAYVQPSRRPTDGRYGKNSNRLQHYYQFQVIIKPYLNNIQKIYLDSLKELEINFKINDIRFVEDNWENPTLGSWGLGWEVWLNGMEITQFTYFQQMCGLHCNPITVEITYGLERLAMHIQNVSNVYDLIWSNSRFGQITYKDIFYHNEIEHSIYNFEEVDTDFLFIIFEKYEKEAQKLINLDNPLPIPAYECILKANHNFNILDANRSISITERQNYILRIRKLTKAIAEIYCKSKKSIK